MLAFFVLRKLENNFDKETSWPNLSPKYYDKSKFALEQIQLPTDFHVLHKK